MKKAVCIDFDGVIAKYDPIKDKFDIGDPIPGAWEFLQKLSEDYEVIIHTARIVDNNTGEINVERYKEVLWWLRQNNMPYASVKPKPVAIAYIDDHAVSCEPDERGACDYDRALGLVEEFRKKYVEID